MLRGAVVTSEITSYSIDAKKPHRTQNPTEQQDQDYIAQLDFW